MYRSPVVSAYVRIDDGCPIHYHVVGSAETEFTCGGQMDGFEFVMTAEALREFLRLGTMALAEMDTRYAKEQAEEPGTTMTE